MIKQQNKFNHSLQASYVGPSEDPHRFPPPWNYIFSPFPKHPPTLSPLSLKY